MIDIQVASGAAPAHRPQIDTLIAAATRVDGHEPLGEHKYLRLEQGTDRATALVALTDGAPAGYAHIVVYGDEPEFRASCELVVGPDSRRRGVGTRLLCEAISLAEEQQARRFDLWAYNHSPGAAAIAAQLGFRPARRLLHLHMHMRGRTNEHRVSAIEAPDFVVRTFRPGADDAAWLALNNRIFAAHPENGHWTLADLHARMTQPWFHAGDFLLLEADGGTLAGLCWLKVESRPGEGRVGEIYVVGVAPEYHGRRLGQRLLEAGMHRLRARGVDVAAVYVDETNLAARGLYEGAGFHHHHVDVCYTRELPLGDAIVEDEEAA